MMSEFPKILAALADTDPRIRDRAALQIHAFAEEAVEALLEAIHRPANSKHRGTMMYALAQLNCSGRFLEIFKLAATPDNFEVQYFAIQILKQQRLEPAEGE